MKITKQNFERQMVHALNKYFEDNDVDAIAYRFPQSRFRPQHIDIMVDSSIHDNYLGIECKSVKRAGNRSLSIHDQFTRKSVGDQFITETEYLKSSGRRGFIAVEIWGSVGNLCGVVPWHDAIKRFCDDDRPFTQEEITGYPGPTRKNGKYVIEDFAVVFPPDRNI